ncbi:MAG: hypothetical protein DWQ36_17745 [Acidobacteria bacterium]|nr:MAG: hypothetical protein DWQ30_15805 [Acidobacteriota bacterium]REK04284.1 MAG: hypothetical protein DWQ36_17745 [Acidobacteriota bacterium]
MTRHHHAVGGLPSLLVAVGLLIEAVTLTASTPTFFSLFLAGAALVALGSAMVVWRLVRGPGGSEGAVASEGGGG